MKHVVKVRAVLLVALLMSAAATIPAWSEDQATEPAVQSQSGQGDGSAATASEPAGEAAVTTAPEADASTPPTAVEPPADASAPATAAEPPADASNPATSGDAAVERTYHPWDWLVYKPLWAASNFVGGWNPIGNYVSAPIESLDPDGRLRFKGFIDNITQIRTTGNNQYYGPTKSTSRDLDWWLQSQEERIQTELKYQTDHLNFVNVLNFNWQGAYGLQNNAQGMFNSGYQNQVYYDQFKRIVRETYVQGDYGKLNFTLGKQILVWGKIDGKVDDFVNGYDKRDNIVTNAVDLEWRTIGQWMAVTTYKPVETTTVQLVFNPNFENNAIAPPGSPYYPPSSSSSPVAATAGGTGYGNFFLPESQRSGFKSLSDAEYGARVNSTFGPLTIAELYYHGFDRNRVAFYSKGGSTPTDNEHTRNERVGFSTDFACNILSQRFNLRTETLYTTRQAYSGTKIPTFNHVEYRDTVYSGLNFETSIGQDEDRYDFEYTVTWLNVTRWDSRTGANRNSIVHNPTVTHSVHATNDKLVLTAGAYISGGQQDNGMNPYANATWRFNDFLTAKLQYDDYEGNNSDHGSYGSYYSEKHVTLDVKYEW